MQILKEFLETSTIHGLAYISNVPSKPGKALWLTIVIAGFCTAGYLINSSYEEWESTPVATSISTHPIATLPLPIITICPPEHANTALNVDLVRAGNISLTDADRQTLVNVSRQFFIHEPSQKFVDLAHWLTNEEAIPQLKAQIRSYPTPYENTDQGGNLGFEIWSTELEGNYASPGFGLRRNCSKNEPSIHFTLYFPQKVKMKKGGLNNETLTIDIVAMNEAEFEIKYREGDPYIFHDIRFKKQNGAEKHCNELNGHLVSIHNNYDFNQFATYQQRDNGNGKRVWLGGSDELVEGVWEWSDGTPWAKGSVARCSDVYDIQKHGLKNCTNWADQHPAGGKDKNCLIVDKPGQWQSESCLGKRFPYWCHIPPIRLEGNKTLSWRLADISFSKVELWLTKKTLGGAKSCNSSSKMPGFSMTWSTKANGGVNFSKTVPDILKADKQRSDQLRTVSVFNLLKNMKYTILAGRKVNMTTKEIWDMIEIHKRELIEKNAIRCNLDGIVHSDDFRKLKADLRKKIPNNRPKAAYTETTDDYALAFEIFSYLLFCQREQIEMVAFYNNLFHTADPRTILQATVNNIQLGVEEAGTMVALHQIYKTLARKMDIKLPHILQGFSDSKMLNNVDQNGDIFMKKHSKDDSKPKEMLAQSKTNN